MARENSLQSLSNIDPSEKNQGALDLSTELKTFGNQIDQDQNKNTNMKIEENQEDDLWHIVKNLQTSGPIGTQCENDAVGAFNTPSVESQEGIFDFTLSPSQEVAPIKEQGTMTNS